MEGEREGKGRGERAFTLPDFSLDFVTNHCTGERTISFFFMTATLRKEMATGFSCGSQELPIWIDF
jgi:hypothetical protein